MQPKKSKTNRQSSKDCKIETRNWRQKMPNCDEITHTSEPNIIGPEIVRPRLTVLSVNSSGFTTIKSVA